MQSRGAWMALSVITGILMIVLGVLFLAYPGFSLATVLLLIGVFLIVYGVALTAAGFIGHAEGRGWAIFTGVLGIIVGIIAIAWPGMTALALLYILGAWAVITGCVDIAGAFASGLRGGQRVWMLIIGVLSVVLGIIFFIHPGAGGLALLWLIGIYLIVYGVLRIVDGFTRPPQVEAAA
jgi:uncharacterized membrane protein HdeD (DUF308 family)